MKSQVKITLVVPEKIRVNCEVWFKGDTLEGALRKLHEWAFFEQDFTELEGCAFQIEGDARLFEFNGTMFHYCFAKGRISVDDLLDKCCYEK